jgi:hypothetical protein
MTEEYTTTDDQLRAALKVGIRADIVRSHMSGDVRVIDEVRLKEVGIVSNPVERLDVAILAEALNNTVDKFGWLRSTPSDPVGEWLVNAQRVADEYARLAAVAGVLAKSDGSDSDPGA